MRTWTPTGAGTAGLVLVARRHVRLMLVLVALLLAAWTLRASEPAPTSSGRQVAMSAECHQAYRGYMESSDPAEADFWAESWMSFGCESGGYWA